MEEIGHGLRDGGMMTIPRHAGKCGFGHGMAESISKPRHVGTFVLIGHMSIIAMKRSRTTREQAGEGTALEVSSLIDVCFLLLIYFLVATTIQKKETDLPLQLPEDRAGTDVPDSPYVIRVTVDGAVQAGTGAVVEVLDTNVGARDVPLLLSALRMYAQGVRAGMREPAVRLIVDDGTQQQRVIDVLNAVVAANISVVAIDDLTRDPK
jgi:biopolymer transport protein ExbD